METSDKVLTIFKELVGDAASRLAGSHYPADAAARVAGALCSEGGQDLSEKKAIGFHLVDWQRDAAFIVALALFPDRFTDEEIRDEVGRLLVHAPAHILEAARLGGYPTENVFLETEDESARA